jgi:hypothetical protein
MNKRFCQVKYLTYEIPRFHPLRTQELNLISYRISYPF